MESMANATAFALAFGAPRSNSTAQFRSKPRRILWSSSFSYLKLSWLKTFLPKRKDGNSMPFTGPQKIRMESDDIGNLEEPFPPSENGVQINNSNDIRKLFNNAQRSTNTRSLGSSSFAELLLRIDSMVLSDMIGLGEASDLRKKITENKFAINDIFFGIQQKNDLELLSELQQFSENIMRKALHVVHICSEMEPIASFRPLAPYVTGLSSALQRKGNMVEVILPKYASVDLAPIKALRKIETEIDSYFGGRWHRNRIWTGVINNIGITLIEPLHHKDFFNRDRVYGYPDDFDRFAYFSRASLDYLVKSGKQPDILHIHNWETAIIGPLFWDIFVHQGLGRTRVLFTCHDLNSQCLEQPDKLVLCGLDPHRLHRDDRLQDNTQKNLINILKGGIVYSNKVVFISSVQSKDRIIQSSSHGLEPTLAVHRDKLLIAPYGFDGIKWDPSRDKFLPAKYSANEIEGKTVCKVALRHHLGFSKHSFAIVGCIFSEASDIDVDNLRVAIMHALGKGAQFVLMGAAMNTTLQLLQDEIEDPNVRFINEYDEFLSHLILAGSDITLCFSFHDPVFQIPLKAIKYGSAPILVNSRQARFRQPEEHGSRNEMLRHSEQQDFGGTMLSQYILSTFANMSLIQALDEIKNEPGQWACKIKDGMSRDFSWDAECCNIHLAAYESIKNL